MTPRHAFVVLLALGAGIVAAAFFAPAFYNDDVPAQTWEFELGTTIVRTGLPALIGAAIVTVIWALRDGR